MRTKLVVVTYDMEQLRRWEKRIFAAPPGGELDVVVIDRTPMKAGTAALFLDPLPGSVRQQVFACPEMPDVSERTLFVGGFREAMSWEANPQTDSLPTPSEWTLFLNDGIYPVREGWLERLIAATERDSVNPEEPRGGLVHLPGDCRFARTSDLWAASRITTDRLPIPSNWKKEGPVEGQRHALEVLDLRFRRSCLEVRTLGELGLAKELEDSGFYKKLGDEIVHEFMPS